MRILLISANREHIPDPIFPLGLAYVAAAVQRAGHEVAIADLCFGFNPLSDLGKQVGRFQPDIIGLSLRNVDNAAYPRNVDYLEQHREVVDTLRALTDAPVVLGGSGFSIMPGEYMAVLDADWGLPARVNIPLWHCSTPSHTNGIPALFPVSSTAAQATSLAAGPQMESI